MSEISKALERLGNPIIQISLNDLREVVKELYHEERERTEQAINAHRERPTLTRKETAKMLGVTLSTLWQWAKSGYLTPAKIGTKVMYRPTDVEALLIKQKGGEVKANVKKDTLDHESVKKIKEANHNKTTEKKTESVPDPKIEIEPDDLPF